MKARASEMEWRLVAELIESRFGLEFDEMRRTFLEARLKVRMAALGLPGLTDYFHYLKYHPHGTQELGELKRAATNNESYFLRAETQLRLLGSQPVTELGRSHTGPLRILSAGCSSGEEPYSMAFVMNEAGKKFGAGYQIDGFDLNPWRVEQGRSGVYSESSLRTCDESQRALLFDRQGDDKYVLREPFRRDVRLFELNLVGGVPPSPQPYDVAYCRNVLIYFSAQAFDRAVAALASWLRPGGILVLGHSESLMRRAAAFEPVLVGDCVVYRRK